MFGFHIVTDRELEASDALQTAAQEQIAYLRAQIATAQAREERLMDNLCLVNGTPPVSNEARVATTDRQTKAAKLTKGLAELLLEETVEEEAAEETFSATANN